MSAFTDWLALNRRSLLRVLLGVYLLPLSLVCLSLSVPPADLPLCGLLFVLAVIGFALARREGRAWRFIWIGALILAFVFGVSEVIAGRRIEHKRSEHGLIPNKTLQATDAAFSVQRL
jgi:energy-coupling factor transporter transmembrane protein EcfT